MRINQLSTCATYGWDRTIRKNKVTGDPLLIWLVITALNGCDIKVGALEEGKYLEVPKKRKKVSCSAPFIMKCGQIPSVSYEIEPILEGV